jgi:hypothetical protein
MVLMLGGCQASVQGDASVDGQSGANASLDADLQAEQSASASSPKGLAANKLTATDERPLLGARRDLTLAPGNGSTDCSCLRVALGAPTLPAFRWKGQAPEIDQERQLVIALSSEGAGCPDPKGSRGASYWGYRRSGDDIIVYVENAIKNRPIQAGAVIPKPFGPGQVYVAPIKGSPYGKPRAGKGVCRVGNPGPPRTVPVAEDETGDVYPTAEPSDFPE